MFFVPGESDYQSKVTRLVLGITLGFGISQVAELPLAYLLPIFLSMLLTGPHINLKMGIGFIVVILLGSLLGMLLTVTVVHFPIVCLLIISLLMFHIFYASNKGLSPILVVMLLIGVTAIPLVGLQSSALAWMIVKGLAAGGTVAVILTMMLFWLIPEVKQVDQVAAVKPLMGSPMESALLSTLVILPLVFVFYTFSLTGGILIFVFSAILAQTPDLTAGIRSSLGLLIANALGGVVAIIVYIMLVGVPEFVFMLLLISLISLLFAPRIFSSDPRAALFSTAFTAVLLLVGNSLGDTSASAAVNFLTRILQIMMAAFYIVSAFYLISRWLGHQKDARPRQSVDHESAMIAEPGL